MPISAIAANDIEKRLWTLRQASLSRMEHVDGKILPTHGPLMRRNPNSPTKCLALAHTCARVVDYLDVGS